MGCEKGYCGPYKIGRIYWVDAGRPVLDEDDPERAGGMSKSNNINSKIHYDFNWFLAYEDCALHYNCAQKIITGYLAKFAKVSN